MRISCLVSAWLVLASASISGHAEESWTVVRDVPLVSRPLIGNAFREEKIIADLFRPKRDGRLPAAVIINSSGGVLPHVEMHYATVLASNGVAALVVDSFMSRGVRRTSDDQSRLQISQSIADAAAGFRWLAAQPWVDASRIVVMGMSKGAVVALANAVEADRRIFGTTDAHFAAHIAIAPGCNFQNKDARTTGAPIFFMLAELDQNTSIRPCLEYSQRMTAAGNPNVRLAVYPGIYHGYEWIGGTVEEIQERESRCNFFYGEKSPITDRKTGRTVPLARFRQYQLETCRDKGPVYIGGDPRMKTQAVADMILFLGEVGVVEDREARAVLPDCATVPEGVYRYNCTRARAGWTGDLLALARAYRYPGGIKRDDALAFRLLRLAADRGHPQAQWDLSEMYWQGIGVPRDYAKALMLAQTAAAAGDASAMNTLGFMAREGLGQPSNDAKAFEWFRQAADLRSPYGLFNLGRMYWEGRGVAVDRAEAVKLWRRSAYYENPWGRLYLAEALEQGNGVARDFKEALTLYRQVADQDGQPDAKSRALEGLKRLGAQQ